MDKSKKFPGKVLSVAGVLSALFFSVSIVFAQGTIDPQPILDGVFSEIGFVGGLAFIITVIGVYFFLESRKNLSKSNLVVADASADALRQALALLESKVDIESDNISDLKESRNELRDKVTLLEAKVLHLEKEANARIAEHKKQLRDKDAQITRHQVEIDGLRDENEKMVAIRLELAALQGRYDTLQVEYRNQRTEWNATFRQMIKRENHLDETGERLDETIPIPDTAELLDYAPDGNDADNDADNDASNDHNQEKDKAT